MVFHNRLAAVLLLSTSGFLAGCANSNENVITRASQVDAALSDRNAECRYSAMSVSLAEQIKTREDADALLRRLNDACPELQIGFVDGEDGIVSIRTVSIGGSSFSDPMGPEKSPTKGGTESSSGGERSGSGGSGGAEGGGAGTQSSGGGSDDSGPDGDDSGSGPDDSGSRGLGDSQGGIGGNGDDGSDDNESGVSE